MAALNTTVIELYGGPGSGKSTLASYLFGTLKDQGASVELVQEVAKEWAWESKHIRPIDESVLYGRQLEREARLYGKVNYLITDRPLYMSSIFSEFYGGLDDAHLYAKLWARDIGLSRALGVRQRLGVFVTREKAYDPAGRFESEDQALKLDALISRSLASPLMVSGDVASRAMQIRVALKCC